ncbi:MAG: hypothetical protein ISQ14_00285 [Verrucomicrobiae bacterium]|nr:hypothetical protein [Verrucomicrobiae bacterium]
MTSFLAIAWNGARELLRQPLVLILVTVPPLFMVLMAHVPYLALESEEKLIKDSALAVLFLVGLLAAVFCASNTLALELRTGTALAVLAKPVSRAKFILAKYAGVAVALLLIGIVNLICALLCSRMAPNLYQALDPPARMVIFGGILAGLGTAGYTNFFQHRQFVGDAVMSISGFIAVFFVVVLFLDKEWNRQEFGALVDWRMLPAGILILCALLVLASVALACSTRLELMPTLAVCSIIFLLGLMTDYLFGRAASEGALWAKALYAALPNWQLFWMADALEGEKTIPTGYILRALSYVGCYLVAALSVAMALFEDRELA